VVAFRLGLGYDLGHTQAMKVAISVPEPVYRAAEKAARQMRVPRSRFYAQAVQAYLKRIDHEDVTRRLNEVYDEPSAEPDPFLAVAARATLKRAR
jgi:hypothetical protein